MSKILVIDNEKTIGLLLKDLLQDTGYDVFFSSSDDEACELYKKENFDIVLTDLKSDDLEEFPSIRKIKNINPEAILIVITANPSFESIQSVLRLGVFDYITKPFNIDEISFSLSRAMSYLKLHSINQALIKDLELHNKQLEKVIKERTEGLQFLFNITREISSTLGLREVIGTIVSKIVVVLNADKCSILLYNKEEDALIIKYSHGLNKEIIEKTKIKPKEAISGWVFEHNEPILVRNIEKDDRFKCSNKEAYYTKSFISIPLLVKNEVIGVINVNDKKTKESFSEEDFAFVKELSSEAAIAIENANLYNSLKENSLDAFMALTTAINEKDNYTKKHTLDVAKISMIIAKKMGLPDSDIGGIRKAALLHDIGKIGIHDDIFTKEELTEEEWKEMKSHPEKGANILKPLNFLGDVISYIEQHHERYDGKGYPLGLKGDEISLGARIISIADSYSAMLTERPHRKALSRPEALEEIKRNKGLQFFPEIVDIFLEVIEETPDLLD